MSFENESERLNISDENHKLIALDLFYEFNVNALTIKSIFYANSTRCILITELKPIILCICVLCCKVRKMK